MIRMFAVAACAHLRWPRLAQAPNCPPARSAEHAAARNHQGQCRDPAAQRSRAQTCRAPEEARARQFYNNVPFHRVIAGFMAQTGDGERGDGRGKSKYPNLAAEFSPDAVQARHRRHGARAAIRIRPIASSSSCSPTRRILNDQYTVIGEVVSGMDVVDKLKKAPQAAEPRPRSRRI